MSVSVLVPFNPGDHWRDRAWGNIFGHYRRGHPSWQILIGSCAGEWSKAKAVDAALSEATGDTLVIADADCSVAPAALEAAVEAAQTASCGIPHETVHRLDADATVAAYAGTLGYYNGTPSRAVTYERKPYVGVPGGGIVAVRREVYEDCPLDPRFLGWGGEDVSWGLALYTLHGRWWRGNADLWHLYHPTARVGVVGGRGSEELSTVYSRAFNKPDRMRPIVEEAKDYLRSGTNAEATTAPAPSTTSTQTIGL